MSPALEPSLPRGLRLFESRNAARVLALLLGVYVAAFALFYPAAITVADEGTYIRQAQLILQGSTRVTLENPFTGDPVEVEPISRYPLGTALLLLPFVSLGGREAAGLLPLLCTVAGVVVTARWLFEQGYSPLWAVLLLSYPATLVMGRVAMSDAPSLLVASLGLWLTWRGFSRGGVTWLAAGFAAGLSVAFRESNGILFLPLFAGTVLRRDRGVGWLVLGGILGLAVRAVSAWLFFGSPLATKPAEDFAATAIFESAGIYLFCLLVLVPGGLVAACAYRGPRRPEVIATVWAFVLFYLTYGYSAAESGWLKRLVLAPRYFIPLLPLLALAAADVWPRWAARLRERVAAGRRARLERAAGLACWGALLSLGLVLVGVQWAHADWTRDQARIRGAIYGSTADGSVVVTNWRATGKFIDLVAGDRFILSRDAVGGSEVEYLLDRAGSFYVVLLDRTDSDFWRRNAFENSLFVSRLGHTRSLVLDERITETDRLRIWRVTR